MDGFNFLSGYRPGSPEAEQFFGLVKDTFGINLKPLAEIGRWEDGYTCHSLFRDGKIAANISALRMRLQLLGREVQAIQLGAVAVAKEFRGQGLSRLLMERVLGEYADVPLVFLFPNNTVLDFYPRFGFVPVRQYTAIAEVPQGLAPAPRPALLDVQSKTLRRILEGPLTASSVLDARGNPMSLYANLLLNFSQDIYHIAEQDAVVIASRQGNILHVYDILSAKPFPLFQHLAWEGVERMAFHFMPDWLSVEYRMEQAAPEDIMFLRGSWPALPPFRFPDIHHT